ncbi:hypothetical protein DPMN_038055 [Dreissena polymorpha]|uniref:Uncharacterized protein n=1 Tax=Dreissena polymorpha TaxID=45954 RepID=A0A9D4RQE0_DREPO|nr:hypothetical protein DPMN_038055 [Dreissena polymorpha]
MLSSTSVPYQTRFDPLIETVALADTRKSQPPIDNRLRVCLKKPPLRRSPAAAQLVRPAVFGKASAVPDQDKR